MRNDQLAVWNWDDHHPSRIGFCIHGWASRKSLHILCCTVPREKWLFPLIKEYSFRFQASCCIFTIYLHSELNHSKLVCFCCQSQSFEGSRYRSLQCTACNPFQLCYVRRNLEVPAAGPQAKRYVHHVHTRHLDGFVWQWNCNSIKVPCIIYHDSSRFNP